MATTKEPKSARRSGSTQRSAAGSGRVPNPAAPRTAAVNVPFVTPQIRWAQFRVPEMRLPVSRENLTGPLAGAASVVRSYLPPPQRTTFYAGLGLLGALSVIDWPVALAIGAGTVIAQRGREQERSEEQDRSDRKTS